MSALKLAAALGGTAAAAQTYVDDVFASWLRTGTGATATVTLNPPIDLATHGGMVHIKDRTVINQHFLFHSARGAANYISTSRTGAENEFGASSDMLTSFSSSGYALGADASGRVNVSPDNFVDWVFRNAPNFYHHTVVTKSSGSNATYNFSTIGTLGMVRVKRTDSTGSWYIWHRSLTAGKLLIGETTAAEATLGHITVSGTTVTLVNGVIADGTYLVEAFAHGTATDGIIQCGSYTGNGSVTGPKINLGWEPQFVIIKRTDGGTNSWWIADTARRFIAAPSNSASLFANTSAAEVAANMGVQPIATGFQPIDSDATVNVLSGTYIYLAIRRPNKPPTSGTQVFQPTVYTGTNVDNRHLDTTIAPDMVWLRKRNGTAFGGMLVGSRLTGQAYLATGTTAAEVTAADALDQQLVSAAEYGTAFSSMSGIYIGNNATSDINLNTTASNHVVEAFKRYPEVFDVVCYAGTGSGTLSVSHNLTASPELVIIKRRDSTGDWLVTIPPFNGASRSYCKLNTTGAFSTDTIITTASAASMTVSGESNFAATYVAYLFATKAGISYVGSYTGNGGTVGTNGTSQTINCGFSTGARFVLIKRTDSTGDWFVFDTARGIVAGNDPFLRLNSTAAEITTVDALDPDNSGFIVNQDATYNLNVTSATYIYLAYA